MKRVLQFFIYFLFVCSQGYSFSPDIQAIINRGELKVALINQDVFPFFFADKEGKLIGSDIELAHLVANELGVKVSFDRSYPTYASVVQAIADRKADLAISNISKTLSRSKSVYFTNPYLTLHLGLAVNRKMLAKSEQQEIGIIPFINSEKFKVGALVNSAFFPLTEQVFSECEVVPMTTIGEGFKAVEDGRIIAYLTGELTIDKFIVDKPEKSILVKTLLFSDLLDNVAIIVPINNPQLLYFLNAFIEMKPIKYIPEKLFNKYHPFIEEKEPHASGN